MREWLLFNDKWAILQLYHGETSYLWWNNNEVRFIPTRLFGFCCSSPLKQQSGGNYVTPLGHIILFPNKPVITLSHYCFVISGEASHTNVIVFVWSYRDSNPRSFALKASTLTATPQRWLLTFNDMMMMSVLH